MSFLYGPVSQWDSLIQEGWCVNEIIIKWYDYFSNKKLRQKELDGQKRKIRKAKLVGLKMLIQILET